MILVMLGATFVAINYAGPWVVRLIGVILSSTSRRASTLLAGRRLLDDPRSAWRTVAGVSMTGFVAGFIAMLAPTMSGAESEVVTVSVGVPAETSDDARSEIAESLPTNATLLPPDHESGEGELTFIHVDVEPDAALVDEVRTLLAGWSPASPPFATSDGRTSEALLFTDIRVGVTVVMSVSIVIAMVSAAISGASSVLDRRRTYALLHLSGTPMGVLNRARLAETMWPLAIMGGGSIGTGVILGLPIASEFNAVGVTTLLATIGLGVVGVIAASAISRPLLRSVMLNASPRPD
ncbi:hypothetical protein STSO111631_02645 [Stackebrandtia soli]